MGNYEFQDAVAELVRTARGVADLLVKVSASYDPYTPESDAIHLLSTCLFEKAEQVEKLTDSDYFADRSS